MPVQNYILRDIFYDSLASCDQDISEDEGKSEQALHSAFRSLFQNGSEVIVSERLKTLITEHTQFTANLLELRMARRVAQEQTMSRLAILEARSNEQAEINIRLREEQARLVAQVMKMEEIQLEKSEEIRGMLMEHIARREKVEDRMAELMEENSMMRRKIAELEGCCANDES